MTIGSLLVSLTATTLGLAAFSPHAAEAGDFPPLSFRISPAKRKTISLWRRRAGTQRRQVPRARALRAHRPKLRA